MENNNVKFSCPNCGGQLYKATTHEYCKDYPIDMQTGKVSSVGEVLEFGNVRWVNILCHTNACGFNLRKYIGKLPPHMEELRKHEIYELLPNAEMETFLFNKIHTDIFASDGREVKLHDEIEIWLPARGANKQILLAKGKVYFEHGSFRVEKDNLQPKSSSRLDDFSPDCIIKILSRKR